VRATTGLCILCLVIAGCGSDEKSSGTSSNTPTATAAASVSGTGADEDAIREVATRYLSAFTDHRWKDVCATRGPGDRSELARGAGSCERAFAVLVKAKPGVDQAFARATAGAVRFRNGVAGVDILQPGQTEPATTLAAKKFGDRWLLVDIPDEQTP
jgi:hypothetical protein